MKKLFIISVCLAMAGCFTTPQRVKDPPVQEIVITVKSATGTKVEVDTGLDNELKVSRGMEVQNTAGQISSLTFICKNKAFVKLYSGLSVSDVTNFWNDRNVLREDFPQVNEIHIFLNSPGGDAFAGLGLADEIERAKVDGFLVTAHASGIVASAAIPVFAVCNKRFASPGTIFMVHEAAIWKWPGRETASDILSQNELMKMLRDRYIQKLVNNTKLDADEWQALEKKTTWFDAEQAKEWGLIDEII